MRQTCKKMRRGCEKLFRVLCALALTVAYVPAFSQLATAADGSLYFEIDGVTYYRASTSATGVQVVGADPEIVGADSGVYVLPSEVEYEGKAYTVSLINTNTATANPAANRSSGGAFTGCDKLEELRIEGLSPSGGTNSIVDGAFEGCDNLEVVHFLGGTAHVYASALEGTKVIVHEDATVSTSTSSMGGVEVTETDDNDIYVSVVFEKSDGTKTEVFVNASTTVSSLSSLTADDIYCDADTYADASLVCCPNSSAPSLSEGCTWSFATASGDTLAYGDALGECGTATEVSLYDLSYATAEVETSEFTYDGNAGKDPGLTVTMADGTVLGAGCYDVTCYGSDGEKIDLDDVVDVGTYTVRATGRDPYYGSCEAAFAITEGGSTWTRASGSATSSENLRHLRSYQAYVNRSAFADADGQSASASAVVLVNPDDYASCAVAVSIASRFSCVVATADEGCIDESTGKLGGDNASQLAVLLSKKTVIVLGNTSSVSEDLYGAVAATAGSSGQVTRFGTGSSATAAEEAVDAYGSALSVIDGDAQVGAEAQEYSDTALVVPSCGDPAVFSALAWASARGAAVFFASEDGSLDSDTVGCLNGFGTVVSAGFSGRASDAIASALPSSCSHEAWQEGDSAYASSASYAEAAIEDSTLSASTLAVCAPNDYGVLASVAAVAGHGGSALLVADGSESGKSALTSFVGGNLYSIDSAYVFASYLELPASLQEDMQKMRSSQDASDLNFATVTCETTSYAWTGSAISCSDDVEVHAADGSPLEEGSDYLLYYYDSSTGGKAYKETVSNNSRTVTSTMTDEGSYTVMVCPAPTYYVDGLGTSNIATAYAYSNSRSFEVTVGSAEKAPDYTSAYTDGMDYVSSSDDPSSGDSSSDDSSPDVSFPDNTDESRYYYSYVNRAAQLGIMTGYENGAFGVGRTMTRAQMANVLWRIACPDDYGAAQEEYGSEGAYSAVNETGMADVKGGTWYTASVNWAVEAGVFDGYENGTFGPDDAITFQQFCKVLANYLSDGRADGWSSASLSGFADGSEVRDWARSAVAWCVDGGLVSGYSSDSTLRPAEKVRRERAATVLVQAVDAGLMEV